MNCQEFWDGYPELSPAAEAQQHASDCPDCARLLNGQHALTRGLRALAEDLNDLQAPARVESGLLSAYRAQQAFRKEPNRFWLPVFAWAAAAAALVLLSFFVMHKGQPEVAPRRVPRHSVEQAAMQPPVDLRLYGDASDDGFIPLPDAAQMDPNDDMNVVRVAVPRTAMLAVGLPVSPDRASELVEADIMLGSDGIARAVKFLNE